MRKVGARKCLANYRLSGKTTSLMYSNPNFGSFLKIFVRNSLNCSFYTFTHFSGRLCSEFETPSLRLQRKGSLKAASIEPVRLKRLATTLINSKFLLIVEEGSEVTRRLIIVVFADAQKL